MKQTQFQSTAMQMLVLGKAIESKILSLQNDTGESNDTNDMLTLSYIYLQFLTSKISEPNNGEMLQLNILLVQFLTDKISASNNKEMVQLTLPLLKSLFNQMLEVNGMNQTSFWAIMLKLIEIQQSSLEAREEEERQLVLKKEKELTPEELTAVKGGLLTEDELYKLAVKYGIPLWLLDMMRFSR